jgi:hypothetical protein
LVLVESRHTVLASLAFAALIGQALRSVSAGHRWLGGLAIGALLASNQGLALRQAEAGRLSAAVLSALQERREALASGRYVVVDLASLAHSIPYTWRPRPGDVLRTYWGLYMFTPWGFHEMASLASGERAYAIGCIKPVRRTEAQFQCDQILASFGLAQSWSGLPDMTTVLDFEAVCGTDGRRCPPISRR